MKLFILFVCMVVMSMSAFAETSSQRSDVFTCITTSYLAKIKSIDSAQLAERYGCGALQVPASERALHCVRFLDMSEERRELDGAWIALRFSMQMENVPMTFEVFQSKYRQQLERGPLVEVYEGCK